MTDNQPPLAFYNPAAIVFDADVTIALIADMRIRKAMERGEFDNLPGSGKPLDLPKDHDPNWWLNNLMKREGLVLLPPSIQLRKEDAALDEQLDELPNEEAVRREIAEFNERVIRARYQLPAGPPLITMPRETEATVAAWAERRAQRAAEAAREKAQREAAAEGSTRQGLLRSAIERRHRRRAARLAGTPHPGSEPR
ncbi:DnaJ family domain-containing protein [Tessaracoccus caeni]|uniref:DnaJ family domain-containing protein n=1 Tax=Tessaracoccus caeni TaxID=3031239 RepID=UPI0023DAE456|nr:DUF1992 domain-containing protein [Tessaracoccus caeni]MDF1489895.1 DUF1992 domain-containing protein [Tessaracoccus caeni]